MSLRQKVGLLMAPDLHAIARKLGTVNQDLRQAETLIGSAKGSTATSNGGRHHLDAAEGAVAEARLLVQEVLLALTGRSPT